MACLGLLQTASAALVTTTDLDNTSRAAYPVSTTDLINGLAPSSSTYNGQFEGGSGQASLPAFTDGSVGSPTQTLVGEVLFDRDSASWNVVYDLDLGSAPLGYNILSIQSFAGHNDARVDQTYDVEVMLVGGGGFVALASVDYDAVVGGTGGEFSTRVTLEDSVPGTPIATGVASIRFTAFPPGSNAGSFAEGGSVYRELDVIGTPVPEPSALVFGAVAVLGVCCLRRRSRR